VPVLCTGTPFRAASLSSCPKASGIPQAAVLAAGCFWGVQGVFQHVRGVQNVVAGYAGGDEATAQYETLSSGTTGHAESVKITFDPEQISYGEILRLAFSVVHDPTQLNRQGPDVGLNIGQLSFMPMRLRNTSLRPTSASWRSRMRLPARSSREWIRSRGSSRRRTITVHVRCCDAPPRCCCAATLADVSSRPL
jgi:methionine-S-sulfoxide reductase